MISAGIPRIVHKIRVSPHTRLLLEVLKIRYCLSRTGIALYSYDCPAPSQAAVHRASQSAGQISHALNSCVCWRRSVRYGGHAKQVARNGTAARARWWFGAFALNRPSWRIDFATDLAASRIADGAVAGYAYRSVSLNRLAQFLPHTIAPALALDQVLDGTRRVPTQFSFLHLV